VATKLLTGTLLVVSTPIVPVVLFFTWAFAQGNLALPWDLAYCQIPAEAIGWGVLIFLGGFLSELRLASWWWSRLWPLVTACVLGAWFWLLSLMDAFPDSLTPGQIQLWGLCAVTSAALTVAILNECEERDFS
jgi:hypothetical protein